MLCFMGLATTTQLAHVGCAACSCTASNKRSANEPHLVCCAAYVCRASTFAYLRENHNSVLGMREYALEAGGWGWQ
jgi:hypothetical protein